MGSVEAGVVVSMVEGLVEAAAGLAEAAVGSETPVVSVVEVVSGLVILGLRPPRQPRARTRTNRLGLLKRDHPRWEVPLDSRPLQAVALGARASDNLRRLGAALQRAGPLRGAKGAAAKAGANSGLSLALRACRLSPNLRLLAGKGRRQRVASPRRAASHRGVHSAGLLAEALPLVAAAGLVVSEAGAPVLDRLPN